MNAVSLLEILILFLITIIQVLQYATEKLRMPLAARRLFDASGQEIYRSEDIQPNQEYYVSSGENFKDPYKSIQGKCLVNK